MDLRKKLIRNQVSAQDGNKIAFGSKYFLPELSKNSNWTFPSGLVASQSCWDGSKRHLQERKTILNRKKLFWSSFSAFALTPASTFLIKRELKMQQKEADSKKKTFSILNINFICMAD